MDAATISTVMRDALTVGIKLCAPMLLLGMIVGVVVAIFQAVTQIHEQSLGFILKMALIILVLLFGGGWMLSTLQDYARELFLLIAGQ